MAGQSGPGKSTLLNLLSGIDHPDDGQIAIDGERLDRMDEAARSTWRAHKAGIIFQFYNLLPMLTAAQNVELALPLKPFSRQERRERVAKTLNLVGLNGRERRYPSSLSGGQQQCVGIPRALVANPALLPCDEPTGNLDRASADEILAILQFSNQTLGKTIVMVTHDPQAAHYANRILQLDKGRFHETSGEVKRPS